MAKVERIDGSIARGKFNSADIVHRVRNGVEHSYHMRPSTTSPSRAQKEYRKLFGTINARVNLIMSDPEKVAQWHERMTQYNALPVAEKTLPLKRHVTARQFVFAVCREEVIRQQQSTRRRRKTAEPVVLPRGIRKCIKSFAALSPAELYEMLKARFNVFYLEQGCRYPDLDDVDYEAVHLALFRRGKVIAYARFYQNHIGRMLTTDRGKGFGRYLLSRAIELAQQQGVAQIEIDAQAQAVEFYRKFGFRVVSDIFIEAGIPHLKMVLEIKK